MFCYSPIYNSWIAISIFRSFDYKIYNPLIFNNSVQIKLETPYNRKDNLNNS